MVVLAGVLGNKQVALGSWRAVEAGIFAFLLLVALSSAVSELHGQSVANRLVLWGFVPLVLSIMLTALVLALPASPEMQPERLAAFDMILGQRSEEHTSELQSLMRIAYAVLCLNKQTHKLRS